MRFPFSIVLVFILMTILSACFSKKIAIDYIDQEQAAGKAQVFAKGLISKEDRAEFGSVFNNEVDEFFFAVDSSGIASIWHSYLQNGEWTDPVAILKHSDYGFNDPFLSNDENRLYYISQKPKDKQDTIADFDIWYSERLGSTWSEPMNVGPIINSDRQEYYISFSESGTMYFASNKGKELKRKHDLDIYRSEFRDGIFQEAERLSDSINTRGYEGDVFIAPDESYIVFCAARKSGYGRGDLYISFKNRDGSWTKSVNMGEKINSEGHELCPFVTKDGKYFFYTSKQDIYWISTSVFEELKKENQ